MCRDGCGPTFPCVLTVIRTIIVSYHVVSRIKRRSIEDEKRAITGDLFPIHKFHMVWVWIGNLVSGEIYADLTLSLQGVLIIGNSDRQVER